MDEICKYDDISFPSLWYIRRQKSFSRWNYSHHMNLITSKQSFPQLLTERRMREMCIGWLWRWKEHSLGRTWKKTWKNLRATSSCWKWHSVDETSVLHFEDTELCQQLEWVGSEFFPRPPDKRTDMLIPWFWPNGTESRETSQNPKCPNFRTVRYYIGNIWSY